MADGRDRGARYGPRMADPAAHLQVLTTLDDRDVALTLAREMADARLIACAQVTGPIASVYRWQGAIEQATGAS